jgi:predicted PurR-regulated permease PerM
MKDFDRRYQLIVFWVLVAIIMFVAAMMLAPFVPALVWAVVLSVLMHPLYQRFGGDKKPNVAAAGTTLAALAIIGIPLVLIGGVLFVQVNGFVREVQGNVPAGQSVFNLTYLGTELDNRLGSTIQQFSSSFTFSQWIEQNRNTLGSSLAEPVGKLLVSSTKGVLTFVVAFLTMFFMLKDGKSLKEPTLALIPLPHETTEDILLKLGKTIQAVFKSVVLVGIAQGTLAGFAYWIAGVPNSLMWGVATVVLCMVPLLGAPIIYLPMSLLLVIQGHSWQGIGLAAFCLIIVSNIDNILKPWIIGSEIDLHPIAVFFALLGGLLLFGPVGLMAGPLVLTLALAVHDILRERRKLALEPF